MFTILIPPDSLAIYKKSLLTKKSLGLPGKPKKLIKIGFKGLVKSYIFKPLFRSARYILSFFISISFTMSDVEI
ncbi:MAG: hypothetical protein Kow0037_28420 [Calditrichia bacterium]